MRNEKTRARSGLVGMAIALLLASAAPPSLAHHEPDSGADYIPLLAPQYQGDPGYWWDHTQLTAEVRAAGNVPAGYIAGAREGIARWSAALQHRFGGAITVTDVTDTRRTGEPADMVVHLVSRAGGTQWQGYAVCGNANCRNLVVRYESPPPMGAPDSNPEKVRKVTMHEMGHGLGLDHAQPYRETLDIMGSGWGIPEPDLEPLLSACDMKAVAAVFAWVFDGAAPHAPTVPRVMCE